MPRLMNPAHIRTAATLVLALGLLTAPKPALAQDVERRPWSELLIIVGHNVSLSLPDGYVEGKTLAVTRNALELDVEKTSNADTYPMGRVSIARSSVSVIKLRRSDNRAPRVASQIIGQAAVMGGLFGALGSRNGLRGNLRGVGIQIGAATAGAAIGRRLDDRDVETLIRVVPEPDGAGVPREVAKLEK
jgi:hypothetical protein